MKKIICCLIVVLAICLFVARPANATIGVQEINEDFRAVFGKKPTEAELNYWKSRRADKKERAALKGAMYFSKKNKQTIGSMPNITPKGMISFVSEAFAEIYGRAPTGSEKTWWADRASCGNFKKYSDMTGSMKYHKSKGVSKGTGTKEQFCAKSSGGVAVAGVNPGLGVNEGKTGPTVRIGIWLAKKFVQITANGKYVFQYPGGKKVFSPGESVRVSLSGNDYVVNGPKGFKKIIENAPKFVPQGGAIMEISNYSDKGASGKNYNMFRGSLIANRDSAGRGIWAINELRAEDYVKGLAETSDNAPEAFQKALAVAARTYVLNHKTLGGRQPHNGFDITNTPNDQWYRGYNYEQIVPKFAESVRSTVGQVVSYSGKLIPALYFSGSDGRTRSAKEVWHSSKFPYLQSKPDPYGGNKLRGHGTGMSGDGAIGFARREGWDYKKILTYYFTGIKLERGY